VNPNTKIKVSRERLITAVEYRIVGLQAMYDAEVAKIPKIDGKKVQMEYIAELTQGVKDGEQVFSRNGEVAWEYRRNVVVTPATVRDDDLRAARRALAQLKMGIDDAITLTVDDFARYIG
jgi:hypothetical protein